MQLAEPTGRPPLHHQLGAAARVQQARLPEAAIPRTVVQWKLQRRQAGLQHAAGLVVVGAAGLAAAAPQLGAPFAGDHPHQQALLAG